MAISVPALNGSHSSPSFFIDGQTRDAYIAEMPRVFPALTISYRLVPWSNRSAFYAQLQKMTQAQKDARYLDLVSKQIETWSADRECTPANLAVLHPNLMDRLISIVMGLDAGDTPPVEATEEFNEYADELGNTGERTIGELREEATIKN